MNLIENTSIRRNGFRPSAKSAKWFRVITAFVVGQSLVQLLQVASGILLFHWLSVEEYAQYTIAFAFQISAGLLVEVGLSGTIIALVGKNIDDKKIVGSYINAAESYSNKLFKYVSIACIIIFPILTFRQNWPIHTIIILLISIIISLYFSGWFSFYAPPLRMHQKIKVLYSLQVKSGVIRLGLLSIMYVASILNSGLASLVGSIHTFINGYWVKKASREFIDEKSEATKKAKEEMITLVKPILPIIIFTAFHGQIMVLISSIFGGSNEIAEIGVLSRIGQLYTVFSMAGGVLIVPYIAKLQAQQLLKSFIWIILAIISFFAMIILVGYIYPEPFLLILGPKYGHLKFEIVLLLISSGLALTGILIWEMNQARKWMYGFDSMLTIGGTIALQILCIYIFNLSHIADILISSIITNAFTVLIRLSSTFYGFYNLKRENK